MSILNAPILNAVFLGTLLLMSSSAFSDAPTPPDRDFSYCGQESNINLFCAYDKTVMRFTVGAADIRDSSPNSGTFRKAGEIRNARDIFIATKDTAGPFVTTLWPADISAKFHVRAEWFSTLHGSSWTSRNPDDIMFTLSITANNGATLIQDRNVHYKELKCFDRAMCITTTNNPNEVSPINGIYEQIKLTVSQEVMTGYSNVEFKVVGIAPDTSISIDKIDVLLVKK